MEESDQSPSQRSALYWIWRHTREKLGPRLRVSSRTAALLGIVLVLLLFIYRALWQPAVLAARKESLALLSIGLLLVVLVWQLQKGTWLRRIAVAVSGAVLTLAIAYVGPALHDYVGLYYRYQTLAIVELDQLPVTGHERIQPLNSVYSLAHEALAEGESPGLPHFVRVGEDYRWVVPIEPSYAISRLLGGVKQLYNVSATAPAPNFATHGRTDVHFEVGEQLLLGRNSRSAAIKRFGPWRFINYEPAEVAYFLDDHGEWIQAVSLIRWRGLFFPRPEFGGVQIIRQEQESFLGWIKLLLLGAGNWIPPEAVSRLKYLSGQSLLSTSVSRYIANSFRFQNGFFAPFPGYHEGDVRIPDLPADVNDQPFVVYFKLPYEAAGSLYHYFALEPFDPLKQGLNTSLFIPADGRGKIFVYRHHQRGGSLAGVSTVAAKVIESRKNYDWTRSRPVEHRPFIRSIAGKHRFFWLTTVVTYKDPDKHTRFIAGSAPEVVITDAAYNIPVWVDARHPEVWPREIEKAMGESWSEK